MKRTSRMCLFAVALVMITQISVVAAPLTNQNINSLKEAKEKREELELSIEKLDNQIEEYMMKIEQNKENIVSTENDIDNTQEQIVRVEEEFKKKQQVLEQRVKAIYMNGQYNYLKIILDAEDFGDFITRVETVRKIISLDKKMINDLNDKKSEVENKKVSLEVKYDDLLALKNENEEKLANLNDNIAEQKELIVQAKNQERLYASREDGSQDLVNSSMKEINKIRSQTPRITASRGSASVSGNNVIAYASNFLGTPYLWGGTSPSTGFDCSGFTQYVYAHFGISLGRTTYNQINDGYEVSRDQLQAGDLVFFGKGGDPTHMGIYIGNNTYIHSPRTGDVLKISPMTRTDYITARRVQ